jgi:hypothetical protein
LAAYFDTSKSQYRYKLKAQQLNSLSVSIRYGGRLRTPELTEQRKSLTVAGLLLSGLSSSSNQTRVTQLLGVHRTPENRLWENRKAGTNCTIR